MRTLLRKRLLVAVVLALALGFVISMVTDNGAFIEFLNIISLAYATAVFVAYAPLGWVSLSKDEPDPDDVLILGILLVHSSIIVTRIVSLSYRTFNFKLIIDTDFVSLGIYLSIMAAICHQSTGFMSHGRVPTRYWSRMGIIAGLSVGGLAGVLQIIALWN